MSAYADLQQGEFAAEAYGYTATRHQREVGTVYSDEVWLSQAASPRLLPYTALLKRSKHWAALNSGVLPLENLIINPHACEKPGSRSASKYLPC
jgi:hypothetical protein